MSAGGLHYGPHRDFSYNYPQMVSSVIRAFNNEYWKGLLETVAGGEDVEELWDEVCLAKDCYTEFLNICCQDPAETVEQVLDRSGFTKQPMRAQIIWCAMLGQVVTGQLFAGIRDITLEGQQHSSITELLQVAHAARRMMNGAELPKERELLTTGLQNVTRALQDSGMSQAEVRKIVNDTLAETRLPSGKPVEDGQ